MEERGLMYLGEWLWYLEDGGLRYLGELGCSTKEKGVYEFGYGLG